MYFFLNIVETVNSDCYYDTLNFLKPLNSRNYRMIIPLETEEVVYINIVESQALVTFKMYHIHKLQGI